MMNYLWYRPSQSSPQCKSGNVDKKNNVVAGSYKAKPEEVVKVAWSKKELTIGEPIEAIVETEGVDDGTVFEICFVERDGKAGDVNRGTKQVKITGGAGRVTWKYPEDKIPKSGSGGYSAPSISFNVDRMPPYLPLTGTSRIANFIPIYSELQIRVQKESGTAIPDIKVQVSQANGRIIAATTDSAGKVIIKKIPPRAHTIKFPGQPRIIAKDNPVANFTSEPQHMTVVPQGKKVQVFSFIDIYVYCSHKVEGQRRALCNADFFEVVPDNTGNDAYKDEVMILSRTATAVQAKGKSLVKQKDDEFGMHAFVLPCKQSNNLVPKIWTADFWRGLKVPDEYVLSGLPQPLTIKCYRPDIYGLQIKFPPMGKIEGGTKLYGDGVKFVNNAHAGQVGFAQVYSLDAEAWSPGGKWPAPFSSKMPVALKRNGDTITLDFMESVGAVIELSAKLYEIISVIQENVPKVGFYFKVSNQFMQGTFVVEWGWKEYKDHRAYYYIGVNLDIKLFEIEFEIGIGVQGFSIELQVYGSLKGSVTLSGKWSRVSPDGNAKVSIPFATEIIAAMGARANVSFLLRVEGTVESGLKVNNGELQFTTNEGASIGCDLQWTGIATKLKVSAGAGKKKGAEREFAEQGSSEKVHELVKPADIGKWVWPKPDAVYKPPVIPHEELHKMVVKMLKEGGNIRVKIGEGTVTNTYMKIEDVAKIIEGKIHARNDIRKDPKSAEALVFAIRKMLEVIMKEKQVSFGEYAHIERYRFDTFLVFELKKILDQQIDPIKMVVDEYQLRAR